MRKKDIEIMVSHAIGKEISFPAKITAYKKENPTTGINELIIREEGIESDLIIPMNGLHIRREAVNVEGLKVLCKSSFTKNQRPLVVKLMMICFEEATK